MRPEDVQELLRARPFVPFRIHTSSGKTYDITHPDVVIVLRSRIVVGIGADHGLPDRVEHCSLLHIERLEELSASAGG